MLAQQAREPEFDPRHPCKSQAESPTAVKTALEKGRQGAFAACWPVRS